MRTPVRFVLLCILIPAGIIRQPCWTLPELQKRGLVVVLGALLLGLALARGVQRGDSGRQGGAGDARGVPHSGAPVLGCTAPPWWAHMDTHRAAAPLLHTSFLSRGLVRLPWCHPHAENTQRGVPCALAPHLASHCRPASPHWRSLHRGPSCPNTQWPGLGQELAGPGQAFGAHHCLGSKRAGALWLLSPTVESHHVFLSG